MTERMAKLEAVEADLIRRYNSAEEDGLTAAQQEEIREEIAFWQVVMMGGDHANESK
jgi:hypothetical protein